MPLWTKSGKAPNYVPLAERRNTVRTDYGYVRRVAKGNRIQEEILIPIAEFGNTGTPEVSDVFFTTTQLTAGANGSVYVSFEPLQITTPGSLTLTVSNTVAGASITATATANSTTITGVKNSLEFKFTTVTAGEYKVLGQTIGGSAVLRTTNAANTTANLVFSNTVSVGSLKVV